MQFVELSEQHKETYNHFVASQASGSFMQSWEWGEWQKESGQAREIFRFALTNESAWLASIQVARVPMPGGRYYVYGAYGPVGDKLRLADYELLILELRKNFPDAIFIRIEPKIRIEGAKKIGKKSVNIQPGITMVVDVSRKLEEIEACFHPKTRYNIKIAERHGVRVEHELAVTPRHGLYIQQAVDLVLQTQVRQRYRGHSGAYYSKLIDFFSLRNESSAVSISIYKALYNKEILASGIMVDFGPTRMYLYGGSSENYKNVMAPYTMHWQAMRDAKNLGLTEYDLGGSEVAGGGERGFTRFKKGFGGKVIEYAGAYDIIFSPLWYTVYTLLRRGNRLIQKIKMKQ